MSRFASILSIPLAIASIGMGLIATPSQTRTLVQPVAPPTIVRDRAALERLRGNSGITLQWVSYTHPRDGANAPRGRVEVSQHNEVVRILGAL